MRKKIFVLVTLLLSVVIVSVSYITVTSYRPAIRVTATRPDTMPAVPHILYLAAPGAQRGLLNEAVARSHGAIPVTDWKTARDAAELSPLDAILIYASMTGLQAIGTEDRDWLQAQFFDGVMVVGLGIEDDALAQMLGLPTLLDPKETGTPIGPTGFILIYAQLLGVPEDIEKIASPEILALLKEEYKDRPDLMLQKLKALWVNRSITQSESAAPDGIQYPMRNSFGTKRGTLVTNTDINLLFERIHSNIEYIYRARAEFKAAMETFEKPSP